MPDCQHDYLCRETDCIVLAEGIETSEELEALCALGVDLGQGYLLGRPARIESLVAPTLWRWKPAKRLTIKELAASAIGQGVMPVV